MSNLGEEKLMLYKHLLESIALRIKEAQNAVTNVKESRDNETKSTAGDKYETGRAMMHMELQRHEMQLSKNILLKEELLQLKKKGDINKAELGSLIRTDGGKFFLSIGLGKIQVHGLDYFCLSPVSPIGAMLINKKIGDSISFRNTSYKILEII